ncbi:trypsin-like serine protease [Rhodobacteraceae bacterium CCMM004]|nr:trypsin-like serine protease [Rhodobacteraceae bacterium CCMM004]
MLGWVAAVGLSLTAGAAAADGAARAFGASGLKSLATADDSRGWGAVGRLDFGKSFCTGTLIDARLVLTAAHCLYDRQGDRIATDRITFLAGWRDGRAEAYRGIRRAVVHPDYDPAGDEPTRMTHDLALLELDRPIAAAEVAPFHTAPEPRAGAEVAVVSYAHDRAERPALQEVCHVLGHQQGALILSCDVDFGSSGAPILDLAGPEPQVVSVVSAKAQMDGTKVSVGTALGWSLGEMRALIAAGDGVFHRTKPQVLRLSNDAAKARGGAKFLRP